MVSERVKGEQIERTTIEGCFSSNREEKKITHSLSPLSSLPHPCNIHAITLWDKPSFSSFSPPPHVSPKWEKDMDMFRQSSRHSVQFHRTPNSSTATLNSECLRPVPRAAFWGGVPRVTRSNSTPPGPRARPSKRRSCSESCSWPSAPSGRGEAKEHFASESSGDPFAGWEPVTLIISEMISGG